MRELGYIESKNIVIEPRYADGKFDRLPELAVELVHLKVDVIVSGGQTPTRAAKQATNTIPIVMANDRDPVGEGFINSLARPGRNITGLTNFAGELSGKRLELLKEIIPKLSRVAVIGTSTVPGNVQALKETELAAGAYKVQLQYLDIINSDNIDATFQLIRKGAADAVLVLSSFLLNSHRKQIIDLTIKDRLPATYNELEYVENGGLMSYSVRSNELYRRAATYVDKILEGAKPADLPVEQPTKFELVINLKTAKQIGLAIPPNVLARADRVIR
jgi:putative ABC transport system substrate-binding protein